MNNVHVTQVGMVGGPVYQTAPADYTTQALVACLCCFWPTGIIAIMKASESRDALARGDMMRAQTAANSARTMIRISWILGLSSLVFLGILVGVLVNQNYYYYDY